MRTLSLRKRKQQNQYPSISEKNPLYSLGITGETSHRLVTEDKKGIVQHVQNHWDSLRVNLCRIYQTSAVQNVNIGRAGRLRLRADLPDPFLLLLLTAYCFVQLCTS